MGDLNASDCSWKKMVIAKANNKWISTMKHSETDKTVSATGQNLQREQKPTKSCRGDPEESSDTEEENYEITMSQEIDPLSLLQPMRESPTALYEPAPSQRRHSSSGPKCESPEERASRLAKMSAYAAQRLANETAEQRANRLKRMSQYAAKRLAQESTDQRAKRLSRMSAYAARRLANETPEQRQARLTRMSAYAARRQAMKKMSTSNSTDLK